MHGYFTRKPIDIEEVRGAIGEHKRAGYDPIKIIPIGTRMLSSKLYYHFANDLRNDWEFLQPYRETVFNQDGTADCVLIQAEGQPTLAACMEGFGYARYVALVLEDEPKKRSRRG